jgi:hypothetical protein
MIQASRPKSSRIHLKRAIPSFTVEVRRRPGRAAHPGVSVPVALFESKPAARAEFDRETDRAIAAIFGPKTESVAPVKLQPAEPKGRVLDSLVIDRPLSEGFDVEFSPDAEADEGNQPDEQPAPRARRNGATRSKSRREATPVKPPVVEQLPKARADGDGQEKRERTLARSMKSAVPKTLLPGAKVLIPLPKASRGRPPEHRSATASVVDIQAPAAIESQPVEATRKRTIMGRYVYGDEPKPGERWKRKLRRKW